MNKRPQEIREDVQEDLLEQIIAQGLEQTAAPQREEDKPDAADEPSPAPQQAKDEIAASPTGKKNRRSAVYLYLLVLFGAAFLMLLLAYFIQQRNSETTISDLRDSINLSREELMNQIRDLEEENTSLQESFYAAYDDLNQWKRYGQEAQESIEQWNRKYTGALEELYSWQSFWTLDQHYRAEEYENCAALLLIQRMGQYTYSTPEAAQERYEEIAQSVIDRGILTEDYLDHISDYEELMDAYLAEHSVTLLIAGC